MTEKWTIRTGIVNGVLGLNGYQYLLDDENQIRLFDSKEQAEQELLNAGMTLEVLEDAVDIEPAELCPECGTVIQYFGPEDFEPVSFGPKDEMYHEECWTPEHGCNNGCEGTCICY